MANGEHSQTSKKGHVSRVCQKIYSNWEKEEICTIDNKLLPGESTGCCQFAAVCVTNPTRLPQVWGLSQGITQFQARWQGRQKPYYALLLQPYSMTRLLLYLELKLREISYHEAGNIGFPTVTAVNHTNFKMFSIQRVCH